MAEAAKRLGGATSVLALTGAGVSVASGLRPYRGKGGLWDSGEVDPMEVASESALARDPERVLGYLRKVQEVADQARPNPAHLTLAEMERHYPHFGVITQNIDGLHRRAGSRNVWEIHGTLYRTRRVRDLEIPDVVLFGGRLPARVMDGIDAHLRDHPPQVMLVIGTTALFPYIQRWISTARDQGALVVEMNLGPTTITGHLTDLLIRGPVEQTLPELWARVTDLGHPQ